LVDQSLGALPSDVALVAAVSSDESKETIDLHDPRIGKKNIK
jgi:hypothetical protein